MSRIVQHTRMATGTMDRRLARRRLDITTVAPVVKRPPTAPTARQKLSRCNMSSSVATELQRLGSTAVFQTQVNGCNVCSV